MDSTHSHLRHEIQIPSFTFDEPGSKYGGDPPPSHPAHALAMNGNTTLPPRTDSMAASHAVWTAPTSQGMRPRPATIHEGFSFCVGGEFEGLPAWDASALQMHQHHHPTSDAMSSRPISVHQDFYPATTMESSEYLGGHGAIEGLTVLPDPWAQKPCDGSLDIAGYDSDMIGQAYTTDEAIPILDLRSGPPMDTDPAAFDGVNPRRMSGSSFTVSTSGGMSEMTSYEDFSTAFSDAPSLTSDYPPLSNRTSMISSTQLSPVASPRMTPQSRSELVRTQSRGRASPSPRPGVRAMPYSVESARNKRWSTGSYGTASNRRPSPFVYHHPHDAYNVHARLPSRHSSPTIAQGQLPLSFNNLQAAQQHPYLYSNAPAFHRNSMLLPTQLPSHAFHPEAHHHQFENPAPLLSHGLFRMLQSNADPHSLHSHYTDLSDPPDLYASLHEEQLPPPPEDMNPSDPDLVPHEQDLRFEGDLYTPRWVRGHGNKREGWCGICKPGRWLVLKNSAFWYDKSFTHGISAATGSPFQEPQETRRMDGNPDVWEGLCGSCNEWIALVSSKKKGTTWFRHAYKCHTHPKIKDAPKRRRESSNTRATATTNISRPRPEPLTPQMTPAVSVAGTPTPAKAQAQAQAQAQAKAQFPLQPPAPQQQQQQQQQQHQPPQLQQRPPSQGRQQQRQLQLQPPPMSRHRALPPQLHTQVATAPPPRSSIMSPIGPALGSGGGVSGVDGFPNMI
ncbi:hypothetical protein C8A00DRAFT_47093 [Chaetomidium leptoderma]|uniref:Transcription regulator Rua1 C-terminal domain-containing protein n=1 Tax=Chaetomidium leptoderma TaxID=669021 RepID=A0AAN6ZT42_9PEZI|nr:hypothetical protein C8A00DRAFT_47093 [Chaetomidium leptoderma]